jgi:hypothetical protein
MLLIVDLMYYIGILSGGVRWVYVNIVTPLTKPGPQRVCRISGILMNTLCSFIGIAALIGFLTLTRFQVFLPLSVVLVMLVVLWTLGIVVVGTGRYVPAYACLAALPATSMILVATIGFFYHNTVLHEVNTL